MAVHSTSPVKIDLGDLLGHFGRYFQTRDDYQNLVSLEVCQYVPLTLEIRLTDISTQSRKASAKTSMKENTHYHSFTSSFPCPLTISFEMS